MFEEGTDAALGGENGAHLADSRQVARLVAQLNDCVEGRADAHIRAGLLNLSYQDLHTFKKGGGWGFKSVLHYPYLLPFFATYLDFFGDHLVD